MRLIALLSLLAAIVAAMLGTASAGATASGFSLGVTAAEVDSNSAILWAHAQQTGKTRVYLRSDPAQFPSGCDLNKPGRVVSATSENDRTVQLTVGLEPSTRYHYRFCQAGGTVSDVGTFMTAPRPGGTLSAVRFAISGDQDAQPAPGQSTPFWNDFQILDAMRAEENDFNILMGDLIYSDSEVPGIGLSEDGITVSEKWGKYRQNLRESSFADLRGSAALYSHWDDHEFYNDFSRFENKFETGSGDDARSLEINGGTLYQRGKRAFRDYNPVTYSDERGVYRSVRWGKTVELFFLDERSFRSAKADATGVCDNPATGSPDLAPTADGTLARTQFGLLVSSLNEPVSQACKDKINNPNRTMLGSAQFKHFKQEVEDSKATFKVIINEVPIQQYYVLPYDRWEGYAAERRKMIEFLRDRVENAVFLSTDVHANLVNDVRLQTLEPGGPQNSGILEATTGPVATKSYKKEINDEVGNPAVGDGVYALVLKAPPPQGVGMQCAAIDTFSYAEVKVTPEVLTIVLKDQNGAGVKETPGGLPGPACGPYEIEAQP